VDTPLVTYLRPLYDRGSLYKIANEISLRAFLTQTPTTSSGNYYMIEKIQKLNSLGEPLEVEAVEAQLLRRHDSLLCIPKDDRTVLIMFDERGRSKIFSLVIFSPKGKVLGFEAIQEELKKYSSSIHKFGLHFI
jgi:hypothetical protein